MRKKDFDSKDGLFSLQISKIYCSSLELKVIKNMNFPHFPIQLSSSLSLSCQTIKFVLTRCTPNRATFHSPHPTITRSMSFYNFYLSSISNSQFSIIPLTFFTINFDFHFLFPSKTHQHISKFSFKTMNPILEIITFPPPFFFPVYSNCQLFISHFSTFNPPFFFFFFFNSHFFVYLKFY